MKKRILSMLLCCLMLFGLVFTVSADPNQPELDPVAHAITVKAENGTASASAETAVKDTEITLTAAPNEGFRFKDLKRYGMGVKRGVPQQRDLCSNPGSNTTDLNIAATDYRMLWPIPKDEVEVNKKLKQNPGY